MFFEWRSENKINIELSHIIKFCQWNFRRTYTYRKTWEVAVLYNIGIECIFALQHGIPTYYTRNYMQWRREKFLFRGQKTFFNPPNPWNTDTEMKLHPKVNQWQLLTTASKLIPSQHFFFCLRFFNISHENSW